MTWRMTATAGVATVLALGALTGCTDVTQLLYDRREVRYDDMADVSSDPAAVIDTQVLPPDATRISAAWHTDDDEAMMSFTSPTGLTCTPGPLTGEPSLEANWWPATRPVDGGVCGDWQVFGSGQVWYLYKS